MATMPPQLQQTITQATLLLQQGKLPDAVEMLQQAQALDPKHAGVQLMLGVAYGRLEQWDKAQQCFQCAAELDTRNPAIFYNLGQVYEKTGDLHEAERNYRTALALRPDHAPAQKALGGLKARRARGGAPPSVSQPVAPPPMQSRVLCFSCAQDILATELVCPFCGAQQRPGVAAVAAPAPVATTPAPSPEVFAPLVTSPPPIVSAPTHCSCGAPVLPDMLFCTNCGKPVATPKTQIAANTCPWCGASNPPEMHFCINCRAYLSDGRSANPLRQATVKTQWILGGCAGGMLLGTLFAWISAGNSGLDDLNVSLNLWRVLGFGPDDWKIIYYLFPVFPVLNGVGATLASSRNRALFTTFSGAAAIILAFIFWIRVSSVFTETSNILLGRGASAISFNPGVGLIMYIIFALGGIAAAWYAAARLE